MDRAESPIYRQKYTASKTKKQPDCVDYCRKNIAILQYILCFSCGLCFSALFIDEKT